MYAPAKPTTNLYLYFFVLLFLQVSFSNLKPTYTVTPFEVVPNSRRRRTRGGTADGAALNGFSDQLASRAGSGKVFTSRGGGGCGCTI